MMMSGSIPEHAESCEWSVYPNLEPDTRVALFLHAAVLVSMDSSD